MTEDVLTLPARLDLTTARRLMRDFRTRAGDPLTVDASQVEALGGLCLQVLLAAAQDWRRRDLGLRFTPRSPAFTAALDQFGVALTSLEHGATA